MSGLWLMSAPAGGAAAAGPASSQGLKSWRIGADGSRWKAWRSTGQRTAVPELPAPAPPDQGWRDGCRTLADECVYGQWTESIPFRTESERPETGPFRGPAELEYAFNMHLYAMMPKYAQNMPLHRFQHSKYADYMHKINICSKYASNMHKICHYIDLNIANMQNIYAKICIQYA